MTRMLEATLKNIGRPDLDAVIVEFPIPEDRYGETIRALEQIEIGAALDADCCAVGLRSTDCPALVRMSGTMANIDELDWLGKRLESFDRYELLQFCTAPERFDISFVDKLVNLAFCSGEVTVVSDFSDLALIGKRHYLTLHGVCTSEELAKEGTQNIMSVFFKNACEQEKPFRGSL